MDMAALGKAMLRGDPTGQTKVDLGRRISCIDFYLRASGVRRLHATTTRSGTLWTQTAINAALDLAAGGDGEYTYSGLFWPTNGLPNKRLDWRIPLGTTNFHHESGPIFADQVYFHSHLPYFRIRSAQLWNMSIVVITRSIFEILESKFFKYASAPAMKGVSVDDESSFDWDRQILDIIEFFNSWGDVLTRHPRIRHYRYEDLKADPVDTHMEICDFWGLDIPRDCIVEGFRLASKDEMKKRFTHDEIGRDHRVSFRGKDRRGILSEARKRAVVERLKRELVHDLGHEIDYDTEYGFVYD